MADPALTCIAIDDEPFALKLIAEDIGKISFLRLANVFSSASLAKPFLEQNQVDLIFLDIQMPELTGLQFLKSLAHPPMTILTTAYNQYAIEGFELEVIDYLMKPIPFDRLLKAANRAHEQYLLRKNVIPEKAYLFVYSEYKEIKIDTQSIEYIEGLKDYVKIFLNNQTRPILTRLNLKAIEKKLPENQFCRIHQSFIVSLEKITSFQKSHVFIGHRSLPIGEKYVEVFLKTYKK